MDEVITYIAYNPATEENGSLIIDRATWDESMKYSRDRYKMSLSKVVEALLQEWLTKEKRKLPLHLKLLKF